MLREALEVQAPALAIVLLEHDAIDGVIEAVRAGANGVLLRARHRRARCWPLSTMCWRAARCWIPGWRAACSTGWQQVERQGGA